MQYVSNLIVFLTSFLTPIAHGDSTDGRWLLIDTGKLTLQVMQAGQAELTLQNIAIGRFGTSADKRRADNTTPLGRYRITKIEADSAFHRFIGLDYPGIEQAEAAYREGAIGKPEYQAILRAHREGLAPPQNTALGGHIGIHGLGQGDPRWHETLNWTRGCIALTNDQIDTLMSWVRAGMIVEIR
ncbi:MAG: L,D-transpeptidase [Sedimenticolaceae bacterium]